MYDFFCSVIKSLLPFNASKAAYCEMVEALDVDWDCYLDIAAFRYLGPPAYPYLQPVIQKPFDIPLHVSVLILMLTLVSAMVWILFLE